MKTTIKFLFHPIKNFDFAKVERFPVELKLLKASLRVKIEKA